MSLEEELFKTPAEKQWKKIGVQNHHGICVPLFSLHSEKSCGVGEYLDLLPLVKWCKEVGFDVIQLLPLNDTGLDTSPYNSLSAFALNPIHLSTHALPGIENLPNFAERLEKIRYWNRTLRIKYHIVRELKMALLREYVPMAFSSFETTSAYQNFLIQNRSWLEPYALFKAIKEKQFWKSWEKWPTPLKSPSENTYIQLLEEHQESCKFHSFIQFLCFQQLSQVKEEAEAKGIYIKGDIPILISRDSADVWRYRHYFLVDRAAGAPPDMYTKNGQYWGFPVYDWEQLEREDYSWWKERLTYCSSLYHLYRIDHIVGFFRIWSIPLGKPAKEGTFLPSQEEEWIPFGRKLMEMMLQTAPILPIGEDLGLVPQSVKECLYELGICGTKMMRWERKWEEDGSFIPPEDYPPMTMSTVSTHDSDTLQLWWRHYPKEAKIFSDFKKWPYTPFLTQEHHKQILHDCHHSTSLFHINLLQEYLALFPELVAENPNHERINIPGKILDTNWTYRFRPSLEQILSHIPLKETIRSLLS
ncbi:MAG: 4-alpha-glucanotransferase [Chlamydiae bacterium]|nr:4-alpha-glucanotransferase [Chlamydiota bacterium]